MLYQADVSVIQESKLGHEGVTPEIKGCESLHKSRYVAVPKYTVVAAITQHTSSIICGDLSRHSASRDSFAKVDPSGTAIYSWLVDNSKVVLNDGSPTRALRAENGAGVSVTDFTFVDVTIANRFLLEAMNLVLTSCPPSSAEAEMQRLSVTTET